MPSIIKKQPAEKFYIGVDYVNALLEDESLNLGACSVVVYDDGGNDVTNDIYDGGTLTVDGTKLLARIKGGEEGKIYKVSFRAGTNQGNIYEKDVYIAIYD